MSFQFEGRHLKRFAATGRLDALAPESSLTEVFHENTKLTPLTARAYSTAIARFLGSAACEVTRHPSKTYSLARPAPLPVPVPAAGVEQAIAGRRSGRRYTGEPVGRKELARLLAFSHGITDARRGYRAAPSGGALYPLELYVLPRRTEGLDPAVYHYDVEHHALRVVGRGDPWQSLTACVTFSDVEIENAALVLVVTAMFQRTTFKYRDRGYRMVLMEAGGLVQTLCLLATTLGLACCLMGGFYDDALAALLGLDGAHEAPLVPIVIGRRPGGGRQ